MSWHLFFMRDIYANCLRDISSGKILQYSFFSKKKKKTVKGVYVYQMSNYDKWKTQCALDASFWLMTFFLLSLHDFVISAYISSN